MEKITLDHKELWIPEWNIKDFSGKGKWGDIWKDKRKIRYSKMILADYQLEEGIILEDEIIDRGGNITKNARKNYHYISLLYHDKQIYFASQFKNGWRVLSDDALSFIKDVRTKKEALNILLSKIS